MRRVVIILLLLAALPSLGLGQEAREAPPVSLKDLRGRTVRLSDYKGKVVLLNFWATWCPPRRAEVPDLVKWQREYGGRGIQVIGVTYPPTERALVRRFVRRFRVNYPVLLGSRDTKALFIRGETLPVTVVIDRQGNVRERIEGILLPEEFEEKVKPLLR
jgi:thiol-disulfide isomerase/thioredoxin